MHGLARRRAGATATGVAIVFAATGAARADPSAALVGSDATGERVSSTVHTTDSATRDHVLARNLEEDAAPEEATATGTRTTPVPILMYHVIAAAPADARYPDLFVAPARFASHMRYLARHRYHVVTLQQVWRHWRGGRALPRKPVVVSFDDGFKSWFTRAYPILRRRGWAGTMNLALSHLNGIDVRARWVRKLIAAGWELDSHSLTHPALTGLGDSALRREVAGSRARLRRIFDVPVNFFCYPSGRYDARVVAAVREAGYRGATTTVEGFAVLGERFVLRRVRIDGGDTAADLAAKLGRR
jgi:peptidoglycan/xylan/chitin deacetylase (PgdA/CDA1 family)